MGLVPLLVVFNHLPYDIMLSFLPNGHVANVKYLVFLKGAGLFIFICFTPGSSVFYILDLSFFNYYHVNISKYHSLT